LADLAVILLRFDDAAACYQRISDPAGLARVALLAHRFGRLRTALRLRGQGAWPQALEGDAWREFCAGPAVFGVGFGGDEARGFSIDEAALDLIAKELGQPRQEILAEAAAHMLGAGSQHVAKMFVLAKLADAQSLVSQIEPLFEARAAYPRRLFWRELERLLRGPVDAVLQQGDHDNFNPKSAHLALARVAGERCVLKENLRLHIDFTRPGGFSREAELLQRLAHPHIVRLRDVLRFCQGRHEVLVLDEVNGPCLVTFTSHEKRLPPDVITRVVVGVAEALAYLHDRGIVYGDVKPSNVMLGPAGPVLLDFGMAQHSARDGGTGSGRVDSMLSTPAYVPPELGRSFEATPAADVFALGILCYELLVGRHPFARIDWRQGDAWRESELCRYAWANLHAAPQALTEITSPRWRALVEAMLTRAPEARPSAADIASAWRRG
jgi:hypothetical protein